MEGWRIADSAPDIRVAAAPESQAADSRAAGMRAAGTVGFAAVEVAGQGRQRCQEDHKIDLWQPGQEPVFISQRKKEVSK